MKSKMIVVRSLAEKELLMSILGDSYNEVKTNGNGDFFLVEHNSEIEMICVLADIKIRTVLWSDAAI